MYIYRSNSFLKCIEKALVTLYKSSKYPSKYPFEYPLDTEYIISTII